MKGWLVGWKVKTDDDDVGRFIIYLPSTYLLIERGRKFAAVCMYLRGELALFIISLSSLFLIFSPVKFSLKCLYLSCVADYMDEIFVYIYIFI